MKTAHSRFNIALSKELQTTRALQEAIHREPELSHKELGTKEKIISALEDLPLEVRQCSNSHGLLVDLNVGDGLPRIAFRADMDALPVEEKATVPFKSQSLGVMHACGHDFHTAILVGTARVLHALRNKLETNVRFIFQPAEEDNPIGGAQSIIEEGGLEECVAIFGLHLWPELETGEIGLKQGALFAASDRITITIKGKGSHAAKPEFGVDAINTAGHLLVNLQTLISRTIGPLEQAVITIGEIQGGKRYNIIADEAVMHGTVRNTSEETRKRLRQKIQTVVEKSAEMYGAIGELDYSNGYPVLENNLGLYRFVSGIFSAEKDLPLSVRNLENPNMVAEDFAFYAREIPGFFFLLGSSFPGSTESERFPLHSPYFMADQGCIEKGMTLYAKIALAAGKLSL